MLPSREASLTIVVELLEISDAVLVVLVEIRRNDRVSVLFQSLDCLLVVHAVPIQVIFYVVVVSWSILRRLTGSGVLPQSWLGLQ